MNCVIKDKLRLLLLAAVSCGLSGCYAMAPVLNPFYEPPEDIAYEGERSDRALREEGERTDRARAALEHMATYQRAREPQPVNPVMQPAVVRLMWVPDHLNRHGDLVPGHYYYLKVLADRWAVQDAFELEGQLGGPDRNSANGLPFVPETEVKGK